MPEQRRCFSIECAALSGPVTVEEDRFASGKNSLEMRGEKKEE